MESAVKVFDEIGLDYGTAVRLFFSAVARSRGIPFRLHRDPELRADGEAMYLLRELRELVAELKEDEDYDDYGDTEDIPF